MKLKTSVQSSGEKNEGSQVIDLDWDNLQKDDRIGYLRQFVSHQNKSMTFIFSQEEAQKLLPKIGRASLPKNISFEVEASYPRSYYGNISSARHVEEKGLLVFTLKANFESGYNGNKLLSDIKPNTFFKAFREIFLA